MTQSFHGSPDQNAGPALMRPTTSVESQWLRDARQPDRASRIGKGPSGKGSEVELVQSGGRCSVFHMSMGVFEHIGRGVVVYVFLFVLLRFVGKSMWASWPPSICSCF